MFDTPSMWREDVDAGERTLLMGVLNVTPDSFSDGGLYLDKEKAVAHGLRMVRKEPTCWMWEGIDPAWIKASAFRRGTEQDPSCHRNARQEGEGAYFDRHL